MGGLRSLLALGLVAAAQGQLCDTGSNPAGVVFDFATSNTDANNLGGSPGGIEVGCSIDNLQGGSNTNGACGYGCGCTTPENVASPSDPQVIRMGNAGRVRAPISFAVCAWRRLGQT